MSAEPVPSLLQTEPAGPCAALNCQSDDTRAYIMGALCDEHAPWAVAGRRDPATQTDPACGEKAMRILPTPAFTGLDFELKNTCPGNVR